MMPQKSANIMNDRSPNINEPNQLGRPEPELQSQHAASSGFLHYPDNYYSNINATLASSGPLPIYVTNDVADAVDNAEDDDDVDAKVVQIRLLQRASRLDSPSGDYPSRYSQMITPPTAPLNPQQQLPGQQLHCHPWLTMPALQYLQNPTNAYDTSLSRRGVDSNLVAAVHRASPSPSSLAQGMLHLSLFDSTPPASYHLSSPASSNHVPGAAYDVAGCGDVNQLAWAGPPTSDPMDLTSLFISVLKSPKGCDKLRSWIENAERPEFDAVFPYFAGYAASMVSGLDLHHVLLLLSIVERSRSDQKATLLCAVAADCRLFFNLCCHNHGSRAIYKMMDGLKDEQDIRGVVKSVVDYQPVRLILHGSATRLVKKLLKNFHQCYVENLWYEVAANVQLICTHRHGSNLFLNCIGVTHGHVKLRIISAVANHALDLSQDSQGNYCVQEALKEGDQEAVSMIVDKLKGNFADLADSPFGSHVLEKCIQHAPAQQLWAICNEIFFRGRLRDLVVSVCGNFIVQKILETVYEKNRPRSNELIDALMEHEELMSRNRFGRPILTTIRRLKLRGNRYARSL